MEEEAKEAKVEIAQTTENVKAPITNNGHQNSNQSNQVLSTSPPSSVTANKPNVVTIPVPVFSSEGNYTYVTIKGSLHDTSCAVFGLNDVEVQALSKRYRNGVKPVINGVMVSIAPVAMINVLAQLSYKVVTSCGEAEICWTLQRQV